jgi:hypothetical protein
VEHFIQALQEFLKIVSQLGVSKNISRHVVIRTEEHLEDVRQELKKINQLLQETEHIFSIKDFAEQATMLQHHLQQATFDMQSITDFFLYLSLVDVASTYSADVGATRGALLSITKQFESPIYRLEKLKNTLLIDIGMGGLFWLDERLEAIKTLWFFGGLSIDQIIKKFSEDELLIVDMYNKCFVHVQLPSGSYNIIRIDHLPVISPIYWWTENEILLSDINGNLLLVDLAKLSYQSITHNYQADNYHNFYAFHSYAQSYKQIVWADPHKYIFAVLDYENQVCELINWVQSSKKTFAINDKVRHIYYQEPDVFVISEDQIEFFSLNSAERGIVKSIGPYRCCGAVMLGGLPQRFIVACNGSNYGALSLYKMIV